MMNKLHLLLRSMKIPGSNLVLVFLLSCIEIFSQKFPVTSYSLENGLNTNFIHDVVQDNQGRMWFATESGVSLYDGYSWKNYTEKEGLPRTEYLQIKVGRDNSIIAVPNWCSLPIAIFSNNRWNLIKIPGSSPLSKGHITSFDLIYEKNKPVFYLGTDNGVLVYGGEKWSLLTKADGLQSNQIRSIKCSQNKVYIATDSGLSVIADGIIDNKFNSIIKAPSKRIKGLDLQYQRDNTEPVIYMLGKEWIGKIEGDSFSLLSSSNKMKEISPGQVIRHSVITFDGKDRIYYGSELQLFYYELSSKKVTQIGEANGFTTNGISEIFLDRESNIWFTSYRGIDKVSNKSFQNYFQANGLLENEVSSILEVEPGHYIFGHNTGVTILKNGKFRTIKFKTPSDNNYLNSRVLDLCKDSLGNVWIAAVQLGLGRLINDKEIKWMNRDNPDIDIYSVQADASGIVWASSDDGLYKISDDLSKMVLVENKIFRQLCRQIYFGPDGTMYGTQITGLAVFKNGEAKRISADDLHYANNLYAVLEYKKNKIFLGTADGLFLLEGNSYKRFRENNFGIDKKVFFITRDSEENFWFGTNDGIIKWDGKLVRRFSVEDGLSGRETNRSAYIVDSFGKFWVGTDRGLSCYSPQYDLPLPPPEIISLEIAGADGVFHKIDRPLDAGNSDNSYTFRIQALSFINEKFVQYRTKLVGFDEDWIENGRNNYVRYTMLPPGDFKLLVEAKNLGSQWSKPFESEIITFQKAFYFKWWFILSLFSVIIFIYVIVHSSFSQKKYNSLLEEEIKGRTKALYDSENKLRTIIENAPITITSINRNGNILFINQALSESDKAENQNIFDNIPGAKIDYIKNILDLVFKKEQTVHFEMEYKNGKDRWIESNISPVISHGAVSEAIVISSDVTERKLNEINRKEIEERQDAILKALPIVLYNSSVRSEVGATWITDNVYTTTGFESKRFLDENHFWSARIHPEERDFVLKEFGNLAIGKPVTLEYRWLCANGEYKWFLEYAMPKAGDDSNDQEYLGIWLDISERKQIQRRFEKLNECFLNFGVDPKGNIERLLSLCGTELNASFVCYNILKNDLIQNVALWNLEENFFPVDSKESIFNEVFLNINNGITIIVDAGQTRYADSDPAVKQFGIKTFLGTPVIFGEKTNGSLCVLFQSIKQISENDNRFLSIISSAIAIEEERLVSQMINQNSLLEKEILLKEIHHRVKNNLQVISSLLFLQAEDTSDVQTKAILKDSTARVRSMAMVHEKLYQSADFARIDFAGYIESLVNHLFSAYKTNRVISKSIEVDEMLIPIDIAIPSGLIINELVTNSLKYAWPESHDADPEIFVSVKKNNGQIYITVADNGIGLAAEINFEAEQKSLGLKLVKMLTRQLTGEISLDRTEGTKFLIICSESI